MLKLFSLAVMLLVAQTISFSQSSVLRSKEFNLEKNNLAIQGYDPLSYFTSNKPMKGKKEIAASVDGITYYFSTAENKDRFQKNPSAYEPQYGGWCAFAMGDKGEKVEIDPKTFKIINGKLYLFYNSFFNNTLKSWNKDEMSLKAKADLNWKKIFQ